MNYNFIKNIEKSKKKIFIIIIGICLILPLNVTPQNLLIIHKKSGERDLEINTGKKLKIVTFNNRIIKGRLTGIKDSSILITQRADKVSVTTEVKIKHIKYINLYKPNLLRYSLGGFIALCGIAFLASYQQDPGSDIPGAAICLPISALFFLSQKKYNFDKYELMIVKPN